MSEIDLKSKHAVLLREYGEIDGHIAALIERRTAIRNDLVALSITARLFGEELPLPFPSASRGDGPTVRDFVLTQLRASPAGAMAREINAAYCQARKVELHPKTIGMTLYRLSREGLACREGTRIWKPVPVPAPAPDGPPYA